VRMDVLSGEIRSRMLSKKAVAKSNENDVLL
jgi:hypothetical protein